MTTTNVKKQGGEDAAPLRSPMTDTLFEPEVDIVENEAEVTLRASMPGVDPKSVEATLENNVLSLSGRAWVPDVPEGYTLVGQEYEVGRFRREFSVSDRIDPAGISARVKDGVLTVRLPKRDEVKTRKIAITA